MFWDELSKAIQKGKEEYEQSLHNHLYDVPLPSREIYPGNSAEGWRNRLFLGDNKEAMLYLLKGDASAALPPMAGKINLIYIDPPYDSQQICYYQIHAGRGMVRQVAYKDQWNRATFDYIQMLTTRLCLMRDLLADDGSLLVHVDYHISHYVKVLLDDLFGRNRFINEIVWCYGGGGAPKKHYTRKHDVILWYAKGEKWYFQPQYRPYREGTIQRGLTAAKGGRYELHREGATLDDWWAEPEVQKILSPTAKENVKYETQKPEGLLKRIIRGHSREGDIVADFFCGSGTTGLVAEKMGRKWIMADASGAAFRISRRRLLEWPEAFPWEALRFSVWPSSREMENHLEIDFRIQTTLGGKLLQVSLVGYRLPEANLREMDEFSRELLEELQKEDWLKLIEYWDLDSHYQPEGPFHVEKYSLRLYEGKKAGIRHVDWQFSVPWDDEETREIAVRVVDILGNEQIIRKTFS